MWPNLGIENGIDCNAIVAVASVDRVPGTSISG